MSLTKASYSMISGAPINVIDYGAVGDGSTDDTASLQAVFNAVPSGGCIEFPPNKTFKTTSTLVMPPTTSGVVIQGNGSTIRAYHNGDGINLTPLNENFSRFAVYNLIMDCQNIGHNVIFKNYV
jgi:polygalacturonase